MGAKDDDHAVLAELEQIYRSAPVGLCFHDREFRYVRINEHGTRITCTVPVPD